MMSKLPKNSKKTAAKEIIQEVVNIIEVKKNEEVEPDIEKDDDDIDNDDIEETEQKQRKTKKNEYLCENAEEALEELNKIEQELDRLAKFRKIVFKTFLKLNQKKFKHGKKKQQSNDIQKEATGFRKANLVPTKFKIFFEKCLKNDPNFSIAHPNFDITQNQPRTDITKMIYYYIKQQELYGKNAEGTLNKRSIIPDSALISLLMIKEGESIQFENFQSFVSRLYSSELLENLDNKDDDSEVEKVEIKQKALSAKN